MVRIEIETRVLFVLSHLSVKCTYSILVLIYSGRWLLKMPRRWRRWSSYRPYVYLTASNSRSGIHNFGGRFLFGFLLRNWWFQSPSFWMRVR